MSASRAQEPHGGRNEPQPPGTAPAAEPGSWERLDQLMEELPPGYPILPDEDRDDFSTYQNPGPRILSKEEAWQNCARAIEKHDGELCKGYREEIDTLLVFAGLFSAVVTAFTVESYQWLQEDPNEAVVRLLSQIAHSVVPNDSAPVLAPGSPGLPDSAAARINAYWFLALTLSLSAALVAILCKQWIREFERTPGFMPQMYVSVRQVKFEGFQRYRVGEIVAALPLLLQLSLAVFAFGVVELLWHLHTAVAVVVGIPGLLALAFYVVTAVLPAVQIMRRRSQSRQEPSLNTQYPYKSPKAWLIFRASVAVGEACMRTKASVRALFLSAIHAFPRSLEPEIIECPGEQFRYVLLRSQYRSWRDWDHLVHLDQCSPLVGTSSYARGLGWLRYNQAQSDIQNSVWNCHWEEVLHVARMERQKPGGFYDALAFSHMRSRDEHRISTIRMLFITEFPCTNEFFAEILVQNFGLMDLSQLGDSLGWAMKGELDAVSASTLVRAIASYAQDHTGEDIEFVLLGLSNLLLMVYSPTAPTLRACVATLILRWIRERETSRLAVTWMTRKACTNLLVASSACWGLDGHCDQCSALTYAQEMAEMTRALFEHYPDAPGLRVSWPLSPVLLRHVSECAAEMGGDRMKLLLLRLLETSVCPIDHHGVLRAIEHEKPPTETAATAPSLHACSHAPSPRLSFTMESQDLGHSDMNTHPPGASPRTPLPNATPKSDCVATHSPGRVTPLNCIEPHEDLHGTQIPEDVAHPASPARVIVGPEGSNALRAASETGSDDISGAITVALSSGERQPFPRSDAIPEGPGTSTRSGDEGL